MIAILSGRYEILHPGHIKTIRREAHRREFLYVYIVDNPNNPYPSTWTLELMNYAIVDLPNVEIILSPLHFGRATKDDLLALPKHDIFLSGNPEVTAHLRSLGENVEEISRTNGYSTTEIKDRICAVTLMGDII